jgi:pyruvate-formate lyase-activating enzyme
VTEDGPRVYRKDRSFVALRARGASVEDSLARVHAALERNRAVEDRLSGSERALLARVREDLQGPPSRPAISWGPMVAAEIGRLANDELLRYVIYRYRYEVFPVTKELDSFPPCLQIEPTSVCNYRCTFCYQTDPFFTEKKNGYMGTIDLGLFRSLVDQAQGKCEALTLASRGEPSVAKELPAMLEHCRGKFLGLKLNTNAWLLDERLSHAILAADIGTVVFSADAATEPLYSQLRVGGRLDRVLENVRRFRDIRARDYPGSRTITRVSGVKVRAEQDIDAMEAFWGELVDEVAFVAHNPWENTYERPRNELATPCSDLWRRMFVWWDGTVNPCDTDYRSTLAVGDARKTPLAALWRGEPYERLRAFHLAARRRDLSPCDRCTVV